MLEPPWQHSGSDYDRWTHCLIGLMGWLWALAGLALGALIAPSLVQSLGLTDPSYQGALVIGVAVVAGFLVQLVGWLLAALVSLAVDAMVVLARVPHGLQGFVIGCSVLLVPTPLVLAGVVYALSRYLTWVGPGQRAATVAFVGGFLVKAALIPLIGRVFLGQVLVRF